MALINNIAQPISRYSTYLLWLSHSRFSRTAGWTITRGAARIALENIDDFLTTYDVYVSGHYNRLNETAKPGSVVWDIGANIGVASLIFAQNANISRVYAYEPMPHTFAYAKRSLDCNPALASKIDLTNLGVGRSNDDLQISYTKKAKAAIGVSEIPPRLKALYRIKPKDMESITIRLADADEILRAIRARHPDSPILLKLDAEGAEYDIVDRLTETGAIQEIASAVIEWHSSPGEPYLTSRLQASGFRTSAKLLDPCGIGMINAWRA